MFGIIDIMNERYKLTEKLKRYTVTDKIFYEVSKYSDLLIKIEDTTEKLKKEKEHDFIISNCNYLYDRRTLNSITNKYEKIHFYSCYLYEDIHPQGNKDALAIEAYRGL